MIDVRRRRCRFFCNAAALLFLSAALASAQQASRDVVVSIDTDAVLRTFDPLKAVGAGFDGHGFGEIDQILTPPTIDAMLDAGFHPLSYRLRTELGIQNWHWSPSGKWSEPATASGYWTSDAEPSGDIDLSYGYDLPRRGNTLDQAVNEGFSRIDDGDAATFWKSDPYLDAEFTGEPNSLHPQWVAIDLGQPKPIDTIKIAWGDPFAVEFTVQYADLDDVSSLALDRPGLWKTFASGRIRSGKGGDALIKLASRPVVTRYLRVLMTKSSRTTSETSNDERSSIGFAVREIAAGTTDAGGHFADVIRHGKSAKDQTEIYTSSTDPWHRSTDIAHSTEQAGFDRLFKSGLTRGLPVMIPVGALFDTPENAASEIAWLKERGYPISSIEIGEEPDGQYISPEDYGALYIQFYDAIRHVDKNVRIGGPSFQDIFAYDPDSPDTSAWLGRFLKYMEHRGRVDDVAFISFEWYPVEDVCSSVAREVERSPGSLQTDIAALRSKMPAKKIPLVMTEYGYSAYAAAAEDDVAGAIVDADALGTFLGLGGEAAYLYGIEPNTVDRDRSCTAGNNMLFLGDADLKIVARTAAFYTSRMITRDWLSAGGGKHALLTAKIASDDKHAVDEIGAYAVVRPDGTYSLLIINRDATRPENIRLAGSAFARIRATQGFDEIQFSRENYEWDRVLGRPSHEAPPTHSSVAGSKRDLELPPLSITVLSWRLDG